MRELQRSRGLIDPRDVELRRGRAAQVMEVQILVGNVRFAGRRRGRIF